VWCGGRLPNAFGLEGGLGVRSALGMHGQGNYST
jgi:hypothetical protein